MTKDLDVFGIGIGPFNLGLAALLWQHKQIQSLFVDKKAQFWWHRGMLIRHAKLQVPFLADLVTLADPTHSLSYLNYLHQHGRLYKFYYYADFLIPRAEYNHYCQWATNHLQMCQFGIEVNNLIYDNKKQRFVISGLSSNHHRVEFTAKNIVVGIGTKPSMPSFASEFKNCNNVIHSSDFLHHKSHLEQQKVVTVIGSGQSAAECVLALLSSLDEYKISQGYEVKWVTRSSGFYPMEYSKLGQECFTPTYMNHFQQLDKSTRLEVAKSQGHLYRGISFSTIADIYDVLYENTVAGQKSGLSLHSDCEITAMTHSNDLNKLNIHYRHNNLNVSASFHTDAVVFATGYTHQWPSWFENLKNDIIKVDAEGDYIINKDFSIARKDSGKGKIFLQNSEIFQQGVGSPDLGLGAYRNAVIVNQLLGYDFYKIHQQTAFQSYQPPSDSFQK
ncbi:SidA/IucD/PvdA family monooxygenase [Moraxella marmotae]|uniref:SidA/IucD/PvdA family monooxygenase n=1 Tax=Moraxella marmotae TaxID=3344520 RepID=UPI0035F44845